MVLRLYFFKSLSFRSSSWNIYEWNAIIPGLWESRVAGGRGAVVGERWNNTEHEWRLLRWGDASEGFITGFHFHMFKNFHNRKINWFSELDYNFPKEILQTVIHRTEYVTQACWIHSEAGLWNTTYHCFLCEEDLPEPSSHLPWNKPTVEVVPAPLSSTCQSTQNNPSSQHGGTGGSVSWTPVTKELQGSKGNTATCIPKFFQLRKHEFLQNLLVPHCLSFPLGNRRG